LAAEADFLDFEELAGLALPCDGFDGFAGAVNLLETLGGAREGFAVDGRFSGFLVGVEGTLTAV
jgi:hypothetical protein